MTALKAGLHGMALSILAVCCIGCANDILDPTQVGRFRPVPVVNVILESLGVADEPDPTYAGTEDPRSEDLIEYDRDYVFSAGDVVRVSIYELRQERLPFIRDYIITESGRISIPDVGLIRAAGLTEVKLEDEIRDILTPGILKDPSVTVLLLRSESRIFSIYGLGVGQSGRYTIPRYTFRLTDAVALAGDVGQFNVSNIYISRDVPVREEAPPRQVDSVSMYPEHPVGKEPADKVDIGDIDIEPVGPDDRQKKPLIREEDMLELIKPYTGNLQNKGGIIVGTELATEEELEGLGLSAGLRGDQDAAAQIDRASPVAEDMPEAIDSHRVGWVFEDGKWIPKRVGGVLPAGPSSAGRAESDLQVGADVMTLQEPAAGEYGLGQVGRGAVKTRVIKIPIDKLKSGDPRYDIIIRPGDRISVPVDIIGEFWVMGNVNNRGLINLTGRPMTLKMAIAMAGGLGPLAWPKKVEVIRRIGRNKSGLIQEEIVMVDLDKISKGQQPDFFIKPYDLINVGTHGTSRWLAVLRNAFRATYGFGFIYDRNFATRDFGNDPFPGHVSLDSMF